MSCGASHGGWNAANDDEQPYDGAYALIGIPRLDAARARAAVELVAVALERRRIAHLVIRLRQRLAPNSVHVLPTPETWPACENTAYCLRRHA